MKTIKGYISTNKIGSECTFEIEIEDDLTDPEIEELAKETAFNMIEWYYDVE